MSGYFIPRADTAFGDWLERFAQRAAEAKEFLGLTEEDVSSMEQALAQWKKAHRGHKQAQTEARVKRGEKDNARRAAEAIFRPMSGRIQSLPQVDDAVRQSLGLTIRKDTRREAPVPQTAPHAVIDIRHRFQHVLRIVDKDGESTRTARPEQTIGCEVWIKFADEGEDSTDFRFVKIATGGPTLVKFDPKDGGRTALYRLRWVNTKGEPGVWSGIHRATVAA